MSDIRFNRWLHNSGTGGVTQDSSGNIGIGSSVPRTALDVVGVVSATSFTGSLTGNATGLSGTPNITVGSITASSATISGNVSVAGTVTYEDVTNVDSVGLVTARTGVRIDAGGLVVVGVTTVAAGSTAAPSISPTGDSNTGIFFPAADTIAFGEGGSEAARIDSSGRFGIGTQSPQGLCDVTGSNGKFVIANGNTSGGMKITATNTAYSANGYLAFEGYSIEYGRFDSSGRLGIGVTIPITQLHVDGSGNQNIRVSSTTHSNFIQQGCVSGSTYHEYKSVYRLVDTDNGDRLKIDSSGRLGIGGNPSFKFNIFCNQGDGMEIFETSSGVNRRLRITQESGGVTYNATYSTSGNAHIWQIGNSDAARIDSSGRLLVNTSSSRSVQGDHTPQIQLEGTGYASSTIGIIANSNDGTGSYLFLGKSRGTTVGSNTIVQNGDTLGQIRFIGSDGSGDFSQGANIEAFVDGTPGSGDLPCRLTFSTTADGASSPTERMRIQQNGFIKAANNGSYFNTTDAVHRFESDNSSNPFFTLRAQNANYAGEGLHIRVVRPANSGYWFLAGQSGDGGDNEFILKGDGNAYADLSWNGGGADYAEYFEWSDSNPDAEDRRGISVVLDGDKIRKAQAGEDPIGVISGNPSVVGDAAWNKWSGKYLRDEFGTYIQEDYEVTNEEGDTVILQRRKLNPAYDPDVKYVPREQRPEWDCVGLMGKLRIRKGQVTGFRWIKMRDISDSVEEWLVR